MTDLDLTDNPLEWDKDPHKTAEVSSYSKSSSLPSVCA